MDGVYLTVLVFAGFLYIGEANFSPSQGVYVISNQPSRGRNSGDLYLYAINTFRINSGNNVEFTKSESGLPRSLVRTGVIQTHPEDLWGCFLQVRQPNLDKGIRYGTYTTTYFATSINTFFRPQTKFLNPDGVFTVTVYPKKDGSTELAPSDRNSIGVAWTPGCQNIRWSKGRRRNINTGHRLTLTSIEDAGIYTIQRSNRKRRGWFVQIEVIVASCPEGYWNSPRNGCTVRNRYPCLNGGVGEDREDECNCPPLFASADCSVRVDVPDDPFGLGNGMESQLFCGDLKGGSTKCEGYLFCKGDLFGCKCFPGWYGNNCDRPCSKGKWGIACSLTCPADNMNCNRFDGSDTTE